MRKPLVISLAATSLLALGLLGAPAQAQSVTFALTGTGLSIAEPGSAATLTGGTTTALAGGTISGPLGSTVVTDGRGGITGWTTTVAGTAFADTATTIAVGSVKAYVPGAVTFTGVVTPTAGTYLAAATGLALTTTGQNLVTATAVVGNNTATFNPNISITLPANATAGTYTGTITQTVS